MQCLWGLINKQPIMQLTGQHKGNIRDVDYDGYNKLISTGADEMVVWDTKSNQPITSYRKTGIISAQALDDTRVVVSTGSDLVSIDQHVDVGLVFSILYCGPS